MTWLVKIRGMSKLWPPSQTIILTYIMDAMASQISSLTIVYSTVYSGADQRKYQSSASLAFVRGIHRWPVNSPHKWPVTRKMLPFDDVIGFPFEFSKHFSWLPMDYVDLSGYRYVRYVIKQSIDDVMWPCGAKRSSLNVIPYCIKVCVVWRAHDCDQI